MKARPFFRWALGIMLIVLAAYVAWSAWDYLEAARMVGALDDARARGFRRIEPSPALPEYADDPARFYAAAAVLIPGSWIGNETWTALHARSGTAPTAEQLASAQEILSMAAPVFDLVSRADAADVREWWAFSRWNRFQFLAVLNLLSLRTCFLARTGRIAEASASLAQELDARRAIEGLQVSEFSGYVRPMSRGRILERAAADLDILLNAGRPTAPALMKLADAFSIDISDDLTYPDWQLQTLMTNPDTTFGLPWRWPSLTPRPWIRHETARLIHDLIAAAEAERAPWPDRLMRIEALASSAPKPSRWHPFYAASSKRFFEGEVMSLRFLAGTVASTRAARVAVAVEQYLRANHRCPQSIAELVPRYVNRVPADPFDGSPIRYRIEPDGYAVYSVGQDLKDDGGDFSKRWMNLPDGRPMQITVDVGMRVRIR